MLLKENLQTEQKGKRVTSGIADFLRSFWHTACIKQQTKRKKNGIKRKEYTMKNLFLIFSYFKPLRTSQSTFVYCLHTLHWAILWSLNYSKPGLRCDILSAWLQLLSQVFSNHYTLDFTFPIFTWMSDTQKHPHHYQTLMHFIFQNGRKMIHMPCCL